MPIDRPHTPRTRKMDSMTRALMALDEIPRAESGLREFTNRPPSYSPPKEIAPRRLW